MDIIPKTGLKGLIENWQSDLTASFSVAMVALPLALGIAVASGVPPVTGIFSAIIGGIVTTFFRGSHLAINGPAAGLIAVILTSIATLDDGSGNALNYVLAAIVMSGILQVLLGLLRMGNFADIFHTSVIRGILAAIGIIIFAKQIHIALGTQETADNVINHIINVFYHIQDINPFVAIISLMGLILLIFHSKISYKLFHIFPTPMWVLILSIPFVYAFDFFEPNVYHLFGKEYQVGPAMLIKIPDNILDAIAYPNFSLINTFKFWSITISITMIATIESLASTKAVDKLDPYKRKTNLNKDLVGIGLSTIISGLIGGLPIITVIVRSTVNVHNHAKTKWSNLYHGVLLLLFIFLLTPIIQQVPLCALAILLVFTGFKLASPKVFKQVNDQGIEQLIFFMSTLVITLFTDLLIGIFSGLGLALITHFLMVKVPIKTFYQMIFNSGSNLFLKKDESYLLKIMGIANFLATVKIDRLIGQIPYGKKVTIDFSKAILIDSSILELIYDFQRTYASRDGIIDIVGLHKHFSSTNHKLALKTLRSSSPILTNRQISLKEMAGEYGWSFNSEINEQIDYFESFYFFKTRPIESISDRISGKDKNFSWEITDITFEEGAFLSSDEYKTTLGMIKIPFIIPKFIIEKKDFLNKFIDLPTHKDIDYVLYDDFSDDFLVKVEDPNDIKKFLLHELKDIIHENDFHHIESNGKALLIFNDHFRFAQITEYAKIIKFFDEFKKSLQGNKNYKNS